MTAQKTYLLDNTSLCWKYKLSVAIYSDGERAPSRLLERYELWLHPMTAHEVRYPVDAAARITIDEIWEIYFLKLPPPNEGEEPVYVEKRRRIDR